MAPVATNGARVDLPSIEPRLGSLRPRGYGVSIDLARGLEPAAAMPSTLPSSLYEHDVYGWASQQAALFRAGDLSAADMALKWRCQPSLRGPAWRATVRVQRRDLSDHLADNPSLKPSIEQAIVRAYGNAAIEAEAETGLASSTFPAECPWPFEQIMNDTFWPET
jgi:hypothetical protein